MQTLDLVALGESIGAAARRQLAAALAPLQRETETLRARLDALPAGPRGEKGADGASVTLAQVEPLIDAAIERATLRIELGIERRLGDLVARALDAVAKPKDGRDGIDGKDGAPGNDGRDGIDGKDGAPGKDGRDGIDGKDGAPAKDGRDGIDGKNGASVTLDDVAPVLEAASARIELAVERRLGELVQRAVDMIPRPKDGAPGKDGRDGADGLGFDDLTVTHDGRRAITLEYMRGDRRKSYRIDLPAVLDAGVWKSDIAYEKADGVTYGGSYWIAQRAAAAGEKPGAGDAWRLAVKQGRDGRDRA